jgi:hypothetical protein
MHLNEEVALSSEELMQENQEASIVYKFTSEGGKDQGAIMKYSRGPRQNTGSSYDKTPYLDRRDNDV